jgi:hypothetical protein
MDEALQAHGARRTAAAAPSSPEAADRHLRALQLELDALGVRSALITAGAWPRLRLDIRYAGPACGFEDNVLAADAGTGWSYWWPWIQPIGPAGDPAGAAAVIADEFGIEVPARDGRAS